MALSKAKVGEVPKDAIIVSEHEALQLQLKLLKDWKHPSDIRALKNGSVILGCCSVLSAAYINNHFRLKCKIQNLAKFSSYLPVCAIPALMSILVHTQFVVPDVVLQKECAVCLEMRASALQVGLSLFYPLAFAPICVYSLAAKYHTISIPNIQEPLKLYQVWRRQTKPISNILFAIFVGQMLAGTIVTYLEAKSIEKVNDRLTLLGYDLKNNT